MIKHQISISSQSIWKYSSKFTGINILSRFLSFPVAIIVAMVLSPIDYGIIGYAGVFISWAGFVNLGMMSVAQREMPGLIESGDLSRARFIQNLAITIESLITFIVFIGLLYIGCTFKDFTTKVVFLLSSIGYAVNRFYNLIENINYIFKDFNLTAKGRLIRVMLYPLLTIGLIYWIRIYTIPVVSIVLTTTILGYFLKSKPYNLSFVLNANEFLRMAKVGIFLTAGSFVYTLFTSTLDRTIITAYLSKEELGLWVFSYSLVTIVLGLFKDYANVLKPVIWGHASNITDSQEGFAPLIKMSVYFSLAAAFFTGIIQIGFIFLVNFITVKFIAAQYVFLFISLYVFWEAMEKFPELILYSDFPCSQQRDYTHDRTAHKRDSIVD